MNNWEERGNLRKMQTMLGSNEKNNVLRGLMPVN